MLVYKIDQLVYTETIIYIYMYISCLAVVSSASFMCTSLALGQDWLPTTDAFLKHMDDKQNKNKSPKAYNNQGKNNKSGVKRLNTLGHLDQYMAQHGRIVKQSYCETV